MKEATMVRAYVLLEVAQSKTQKVLNELTKMGFVKQFDAITGNYDIIAHIEGLDQNDLGKMVATQIAPLDGVERTVTYPVIEF
ncbi:MAG: Lrp/AsnC family transcriptional regulator [Myxococcales bacterium]|nr:MAG: Lrp/AsnC family transcriptional regulator [Myxococcales bacterium]